MAFNFIPKIQWLNTSVVGDTTISNATITNIPSTADVQVGMYATGSGIPAGATVLSKTATTVTLSANATATATGVTVSFFFEFTFTYPPVIDPYGRNTTAVVQEDVSLAGIRQVAYLHSIEVRAITYRFLSSSDITSLKNFFDTHAKLALPFRYFTHATESAYTEYELATFAFEPAPILPKSGDFLYELSWSFRRVY